MGDGHGSWKTEGGHSQGVVTAKQLYLVLSENETPAAKSLASRLEKISRTFSLFGCLNLASSITFLKEISCEAQVNRRKMNSILK